MAKGKKAAKKVVDQLLEGAIAGAKKGSKRAKVPRHTGKVDIDVTGRGSFREFDFEDAVKVLKAKDFAANREAAAEAAEEAAQKMGARAEEVARVLNGDRAEAKRLRAEAEAATGADASAKAKLAEAAEAKAKLSQDKFQTLDDEAARTKAVALRRRNEADEAANHLTTIEGQTGAAERQRAIDAAIEQAEARARQIEYEEKADEIVGKLTQITESYQQAMRDRAQASRDLLAAEQRLSRATLNARRAGADPQTSDQEIRDAEAALEQAKTAHQDAQKRCDQGSSNRIFWRKKTEKFLEDPETAVLLSDSRVQRIQEARLAADRAADAVALERVDKKVERTVGKLDEATNQLEMAGLDREQARQARIEAQRQLKEAGTDEEIRAAQDQLEIANQAYETADGTYKGFVNSQKYWRDEAQKALAKADSDTDRELLQNALGRAKPTISMQERLFNAAAERDEAYAKLAQAQQRWRDAMEQANASDDPGVQAAAENLQKTKEELDSTDGRIMVLQGTAGRWLDDDYLPATEREGLVSVLDTVKTTNAERETIYVLDGLAESKIKIDLSVQAKDEAYQVWRAAKDNLDQVRESGGDTAQAEKRVAELREHYETVRARWLLDRAAVQHWEKRYERIIPAEHVVSARLNKDAIAITGKLEDALAARVTLIQERDRLLFAKKAADAKVAEFELAGADNQTLEKAREIAREANQSFEAARSQADNNRISIELWERKANELLASSDDAVLTAFNRGRLEDAITQAHQEYVRSPQDVANLLGATITRRDLEYDAVAEAQRELHNARSYLTLARESGEGVDEAEIEYRTAQEALAEAEKNLRASSANSTIWENKAKKLLEQEDLPEADRVAIQTALDGAERLKAAREPDFIRGSLAEKGEQVKEANQIFNQTREIQDIARDELVAARQSGDSTRIESAEQNLAEAREAYDRAHQMLQAKSKTYKKWQEKAIATGVIAATSLAVVGETAAAEVREMPQGLGQETEADRKAWEEAQLRAFVQKNNKEWQEAKAAYEAAKKVVFPEGTDSDEAIGYINLASVEQMDALNRATLRLDKAEDSVEAQVQALKQARQEARAEAAQRAEAADHLLVARHTNRKLHEAKEGLKAIPTTARELLARQRANEKDLETARASVELAESGEQALHIMRNSSSGFFEGTSPEEIASLEVANKEQLAQARAQLEIAEAEAKTIAEAHAKLAPDGKSLEELAGGEEVHSRVQEARLVAAQIAANQAEHNYVQERVRLQREDPKTGIGDWAQEILTKRAEREAKREARLAKAAKGIVEPISNEEKELGFGYDPKTGNFTDFEGPFIMRTTNNLASKYVDKEANLADPRFLVWFVENYDKLPATQQTLLDEILPPELKEFALIAYDFYKSDEVRNEMELDRMLSRDMYGPSIVIPDQKIPEEKPEVSPEPKVAEALMPKEMSGSKNSKEKAWKEAEKIPASQNYTPNVWESPDVNYSGDDGAYETAMSVEQSMEQASTQPTTSGPRLY